MNIPTKERFQKDVEAHKVDVLLDNGVYRHLHCSNNGSSNLHFDIVTYPGNLVFSGDMGCFVFKRMKDMFRFFRINPKCSYEVKNWINAGYWAEKVEAGKISKWSEGEFRAAVNENLQNWLDDAEDNEHSSEFIELQKMKVADEFRYIEGEWDAVTKINEWDADKGGVTFDDFWENSCKAATFHYIWCCYAIVWAIGEYDKQQTILREGQ